MRNVTITLPEQVARWARVLAAQENTSVSRLLGEMLEERMQRVESYATAKQSFLSRQATELKKSGSYPRRDELHER